MTLYEIHTLHYNEDTGAVTGRIQARHGNLELIRAMAIDMQDPDVDDVTEVVVVESGHSPHDRRHHIPLAPVVEANPEDDIPF